MKNILLRFCLIFAILFFNIGINTSVIEAIDENLLYTPKDIMENGNTTIEGGRYSYDSFKIQEYLFKGYKFPPNAEKMVFFTFDDGPSIDNTPKVLDILKEHGVKATFFVLGINLDNNEERVEILKRIIDEGHAIANHGYSHNYSYLYPGRVINYENLIADMNRSHEILKSILGDSFNTRILRLPGGLRSWKGQNEVLERLNVEGYSVIEWNALNGDSEAKQVSDPSVLVQNAINTSKNSDFVVLLMHDFAGNRGDISMQSLPDIIRYYKDNGYQFRTMY